MKIFLSYTAFILIIMFNNKVLYGADDPYTDLLITIENEGFPGCDVAEKNNKSINKSKIRFDCTRNVDMLLEFWSKHLTDTKICRLMKRIAIKYNDMKWFSSLGVQILKLFRELWKYDLNLAEQMGMEFWRESEDKTNSYLILYLLTSKRMKKKNLIEIAKGIKDIKGQTYEAFNGKFHEKKESIQKDWIEFIKESKCEEAIKLLPSMK